MTSESISQWAPGPEVQTQEQRILAALWAGDPNAPRALYDTYAGYVDRVLCRILGPDGDIPDLLQEVFVAALANFRDVRKGESLKHWLASVAVFKARSYLRKMGRRRRLRALFLRTSEIPHVDAPDSQEAMLAESLRLILDKMSSDLRIPFSLRHLEGMQLEEVASVCGVSLATIKRRLGSAEGRFLTAARQDPDLWDCVSRSGKWKTAIAK
ncbi:MAG: RNA polymerase sigma factor [Deltaproteobacteria bacterium]|nr:RNA polymerase sigma factor [Deltaproteobacteria bacterium]